MRDDAVVRGRGPDRSGAVAKRGRAGRQGSRLVARGQVAWFLMAAIVLPWLPIPDAPPGDLPMRRARGRAGAVVWNSAFDANGLMVATSDDREHVTLRTAAGGWGVRRRIDVPGCAKAMAFSPDGRHLAIGREEPDIFLYELGREDRPRPLGIPVRSTSDLRFSPDGRTLAVSSHRSREIIVWDLDAGRRRMTLRGHDGPVSIMAFGPDGRSLASSGVQDRMIVIWDLDTGVPGRRVVITPIAVSCLAYSPDGRLLAAASPGRESVRIWDIRTGESVGKIAGGPLPIRSVAFSPDGRQLATASAEGTAGLWDPATGRELRRLEGGAQMLGTIAFSADGLTLLASGNDDDIRLWDLHGLGSPE